MTKNSRITILIIFALVILSGQISIGQDSKIHGLTTLGGNNGGGNIYSFNGDGSDFE
ncbi:MAG: hypothetical protein ACJA2S_005448 [Cyclobacteriaceae bacterium]|jgi:hypothetical protein